MKKTLLLRANALIGTVILSLLGLNSCEGPLVKYGAPDPTYSPAPVETVEEIPQPPVNN